MSTKTINHMLLERLEDTSISSTLVQQDIDILKQKDAIIWEFYSHRFVSSYDFVEDFYNVDHNQITISCNTSCNWGGGDDCMYSCSDTSRQDPYMQMSTVADPGFGGRGGVNFHKQGRSPCPRHEVPSGGRVREGGCPPSPSCR